MRDVPGDKLAVRTIAELLIPAGYREGLTMCLRTIDGRVTGLLNLSTDDERHPTDDAATALGALCSTLANVADATQSARFLLELVEPAPPPSPSGTTAPCSRCRASPAIALFEEPSRLLRVARRLAAQDRRGTRFLWPGARAALAPRGRDALPRRHRAAAARRLRGPRARRRRPDPARARGADDGDAGLVERRDRRAALDLAAHRRHLRRADPRSSSRVPTRAAAAARAVAEGLIVPLEALLPLRSVS